ncbi:MAG TPA: DUF87 domain-containing protein [Acidimicrobiales bacterium]|nr:DUF87 domain-containing protein [Acidimicrobiales bacterium]
MHEATTAQLGAAYPAMASRPLPAAKVVVGRDLLGGLFAHDPFELYEAGAVSNPNLVVFGQIGRGKSAFVKSYLYRHAAFGRRVVVLDPKGEYGPLAEALGACRVRLSPGGTARLNPLEVAGGTGEDVGRQRLAALGALAAACCDRPLRPVEHAALELALGSLAPGPGAPTLGQVVEALLFPDPRAARTIGCSAEALREGALEVALELRRLTAGELRGMFDGQTAAGVDLAADAVVLDLSAVYDSPALGALMTCAALALGAAWRRAGGQTLFVVDEAWAILSNLGAARFLQASFKLARANGVANLAVVHRVSDLAAAGAEGSVAARLAEGLLADCETVVCYGLSRAELVRAAPLLGLDERQAYLLAGLARGVALWRVAGRTFLVEHRLAPGERSLVDTDARLVGRLAPAPAARPVR